jgi:hypothetical protein
MDVINYLENWWYIIGEHANNTSTKLTADMFSVELGLGRDYGMLQGVRDITDIYQIVLDLKCAVSSGVSASDPVPDLGDSDPRNQYNYAGGESF